MSMLQNLYLCVCLLNGKAPAYVLTRNTLVYLATILDAHVYGLLESWWIRWRVRV